MVPGAGVEPARHSASDFKSDASTNFATRAWCAFYSTEILRVTRCHTSGYGPAAGPADCWDIIKALKLQIYPACNTAAVTQHIHDCF